MKYVFAIPYRDRAEQLELLLSHLRGWIPQQPYITSHAFVVVEQANDRRFNLGWCINVGFAVAQREVAPWRFVFQPVDCLPLSGSVARQGTPDQVLVDVPSIAWESQPFEGYETPAGAAVLLQPRWWTGTHWSQFGTYYKALAFDPDVYAHIDGHSNAYEGWGREDDDLLLRLEHHHIPTIRRGIIFHELPNPPQRDHSPDGHKQAWAEAEGRLERDGLSTLTVEVAEMTYGPESDTLLVRAW